MLKFQKAKKLFSIVFLSLIMSFVGKCLATPAAAIYHDPAIFYTPAGVNPFYYIKNESKWVVFELDPYYQHASGAKNTDGVKVPLGDRLGRWNMLGLLNGTSAAPETFSAANYPDLYAAKTNISAVDSELVSDTFTTSAGTLGSYSIPVKNEKYGIRTKCHFNFGAGFFANIRGGFTHYKWDPTFNDQTSTSTFVESIQTVVIDNLMTEEKRDAAASDIGLNIDMQSKTALEDFHVELGWSNKFGMNDEENKLADRIMPYLAVGLWLPTGEKKDQDQAFSIPTGNDGFFGLSVEGAMNFDFPKTVQLNVGGGLTYFEKKRRNNYRVPSTETQLGIYPWKVPVSMRLGTTWHLYAGFMSQHFAGKLSCFFNYVYTKKEKDSITMEDTATRNALFKPKKLENESSWESQVWHLGLDYDITEHLAFGISVQSPITGKKIARTLTLLGAVRFSF